MRVLVTGGSGFIGSHVVDRLRAHGHVPHIYDERPSPWHPPGEVAFTQGCLTDAATLEQAMLRSDAVIHLAAVADVNHVHADPGRAEEVNTRGTLAVLDAARQGGVSRLVYGSTIWVYSDCEDDEVDEDTPLHAPAHFYTATKLAGELYVRSYTALYGLEHTSLRCGIPYGPRARPAAVVPAFVERALRGEALTIAGDGSQGRRFVYVEDLAEGVARSLAPVAANRTYNLAGDETVTIRRIAELVQEHVAPVEIERRPARGGDFGGKEVSSARAAAELGWQASTPFEEGLRRYVAWRRKLDAVPEGPAAPATAQRARRVLILSADIGEGHDAPARELAAELAAEDPGVEVEVRDGLAAMGRVMTATVRDGSWFAFRRAQWLFTLQYWLITSFPPTRWLARRLLYGLGGRRLARLVRRWGADAVISTYPGVTEVLGELRRRRRLDVPCYSAITDLAGLRYWAHPGIDLHFVTHPESIEEVERIAGPGRVRWTRPPTSPAVLAPIDRAQAREALDLPADDPVILVSGGGWGMGDLEGATEVALEVPRACVVVLAGRNEEARAALEERFAGERRVRVMGFTDRMGELLASADALVHSTAGLTVLEAIIRGCPVISYGFAIGHIRANNRAFARFGLARTARDRDELARALKAAVSARPAPDESFARRPTSASFVLGGWTPAPRERPASALARLRPAWSFGLAALSTAALALGTDIPYGLIDGPLHARPISEVKTDDPVVGLLLDVPPADDVAVARALHRDGVRASFEIGTPPARPTVATLHALGQETVPVLRAGAGTRWLSTRSQLAHRARRLGLHGHVVYVAPGDGFTLGQWFLARTLGARAVRPAMDVHAGPAPQSLRRGMVLRLSLRDGSTGQVVRVVRMLRRDGVHPVPVGTLLRLRD